MHYVLASFLILLAAFWSQPVRSALVADLSEHLIAITTAFSGSDVLLFGAVAHEGRDIAVVVRGPSEDVTVMRKGQFGPIWLNAEEMSFRGAPSFYAISSSRPLEEMADRATLQRHSIGLDHIDLTPSGALGVPTEEIEAYRQALVRNKQAAELYSFAPRPVQFLGGRLFRTELAFPANVPPGNYDVDIFEFEDGLVTAAQRSVLVVSKVGAEAELFDLARQRPALYGLICIVIAVTAGWTASAVFRRA